MSSFRILVGDARKTLAEIPDQSVHCVVTSPPYWNLRRYEGDKGMIGLEPTFEEHIGSLLEVFREVHRVLRDDGTFWLNYGDSHANNTKWGGYTGGKHAAGLLGATGIGRSRVTTGLKPKDLLMMPARIAMALQFDGAADRAAVGVLARVMSDLTDAYRDGEIPSRVIRTLERLEAEYAEAKGESWWIRSRIAWVKSNPMPESVRNRPVNAYEEIFLLAKSGVPLFWTHDHGHGVRSRPDPHYYWRHKRTWEVTHLEPPNWREQVDDNGMRVWSRLNHWTGHDYYYDFVGVRTPQKPDSIERLSRRRNVNAHVGPGMAPHAGIVGPRTDKQRGHSRRHAGFNERWDRMSKDEQAMAGANLRNVWWMTPKPFAGRHFATFPPQLPETVIKAATSEHGCCPSCGAPYARQTETMLVPTSKAARRCVVDERDKNADPRSAGNNRQKDGMLPGWANSVRTKGWFPTCECDAGDPVPCTVLDPFAGAGTVAIVANELGRDAILCEISPRYADMARERIEKELGVFANEQGET